MERLAAIKTVSAELESTCIVFAYGLDLHLTRVFPSKKFDVLNDDFGHWTLLGSLASLAAGVVLLSRMATRHQLDQLWL